jgi:DNA-binding NtrC family response regulator
MSSPRAALPGAVRVVICDYNSLLQSVSGFLRMSGYSVFQAYNGEAAEELCGGLHGIALLILNTEGTGVDTPGLVRSIRKRHANLPVLHIGRIPIPGMPSNVSHLAESFTPDQLLETVSAIAAGRQVQQLVTPEVAPGQVATLAKDGP